jgi:hypothetical protein
MTMPQQPIGPQRSGHKSVGTLVEAAAVIACSLVFALYVTGICVLLFTSIHPGYRDIGSYWAAGRLIDRHANPYDASAVQKIQESLEFAPGEQPLIMRNPPTALCLVMPIGLLKLRYAAWLWSAMLLGSLLWSVRMLRAIYGPRDDIHGRPHTKVHYLGYTFGPALICIFGGQTSLFALLGLVLFLRFHQNRPALAGVALWLCALKPHLFLPFGVVLLVWILVNRRYRLLGGAVLAMGAASLAATSLDPWVWPQYAGMLRSSAVTGEFIPCLGVALRFALRPSAMWLQYLPVAIGCAWALHFYWRRRYAWDWVERAGILMLVSVLVAPYAWLTDQALLIPAVLLAAYSATSRAQLVAVAVAGAFLEAAHMAGQGMHSLLYLWTSPFWLVWYLYVSAKSKAAEGCERTERTKRGSEWLRRSVS